MLFSRILPIVSPSKESHRVPFVDDMNVPINKHDANAYPSPPLTVSGNVVDDNEADESSDGTESVITPSPRNVSSPGIDDLAGEGDDDEEDGRGGDGVSGDDDLSTDRNGQHHPIAEFLYQLTKMLTDDNSKIIEWSGGRIRVHFPDRLESEVLHKYFRHSKFASFQRQLNYFGFRKIAGKGKMSPCSYVNESATNDIRSLLLIKRKTNGSAARKAAMQQRAVANMNSHLNPNLLGLNGLNFSQLVANPQLVGGMNMNMNQTALTNAMALLSENAFRAGLGSMPHAAAAAASKNPAAAAQLSLLNLQQQQQQIQQQIQQQQQQLQLQQLMQNPSNEQLAALFPSSHKIPSFPSLGQDMTKSLGSWGYHSKTPSLQELQAQYLAASQPQPAGSVGNGFNFSALQPSSMSLNVANPATAALQAQNMSMPATAAAMDAASHAAIANNNMFDNIHLKSLLQEHQESQQRNAAAAATAVGNAAATGNSAAMNQVLNRLPSSGAFLPDSMSSVSLGNFLGSSNRLNSLLSLNSFMGSREPSLADLAAFANRAQLANTNTAAVSNSAPLSHASPPRGAIGGGGVHP